MKKKYKTKANRLIFDWLLFFSPDRADILCEERTKIKAKAGNSS
jgi:hypothetical protein